MGTSVNVITEPLHQNDKALPQGLHVCPSYGTYNKERALDLLAEYHDIFALEDGEMGCTAAAKHKIEVTDPKLSKGGQEIFHQVFLRR